MTTNQNLIQLSHQHLNHLRSQTKEIQKKIQKVDTRINAKNKTKESILSKERSELERRLQAQSANLEESKKRNEVMISRVMHVSPITSIKASKVQLEMAKQQFMSHMSELFHGIEIEEKKRKLLILKEMEERIRSTEELKQRAREEWEEEMLLEQALTEKESALRLAEEEARKEAIERQLLRKKFEDKQAEKRRALLDHTERTVAEFISREDRRISEGTTVHLEYQKQELNKIYEQSSKHTHNISLEEAFPEFAVTSSKRQPQQPMKQPIKQPRKPSTPVQYSAPIHESGSKIPEQHILSKQSSMRIASGRQPLVPELPLQSMPQNMDSFSDSSISVTEDEKSIHKQPSEDSAYYHDGYSTMNESVDEVATFSQFKKAQRSKNSDVSDTIVPHQSTELYKTQGTRHKIPNELKNQSKEAYSKSNAIKQEITSTPRHEYNNEISSEESVEESIIQHSMEQSSEKQTVSDFKFIPNDLKGNTEKLQMETRKSEPMVQDEAIPQTQLIESNSNLSKRPIIGLSSPNRTSSDTSPQEKVGTESIESYNSVKSTEAMEAMEKNSIINNEGRAPSEKTDGITSVKSTSSTVEEKQKPGTNENTSELGRLSFFSRLTKNRTRRQSRQNEPPVMIEDEKEEESDYYTTETGSEAPQSALERKACSEVRRFLRTTFPVKIVMGLQELATSIENDMNDQYTKGTLSSRLRGRSSSKYPFPYEKRFTNRKSPLSEHDGPSRVKLIEAAIDSDEEVLAKYPYPIKSELLLDIIKYTPNTFITKQVYEKLHDSSISLDEWTTEFLEQKAQVRGPTLEMWKLIISHVKFLCKTDSSKKNHVIAAFASVLTPRPSEKLGTSYIKNRDDTIELVKKLIEFSCEGNKKKLRLSLSGGNTRRKSSEEASASNKKSTSAPKSALFPKEGTSTTAANRVITGKSNSGIILGGGRRGPIGSGVSSFGSGNILDRLKSKNDFDSEEDDIDEDDLNVVVFQDVPKKSFDLGSLNFQNNSNSYDEFGEFGEFDL